MSNYPKISRLECIKRLFKQIFTGRWDPDIDIKRTRGDIAIFVIMLPLRIFVCFILLPFDIIGILINPAKYNRSMCERESGLYVKEQGVKVIERKIEEEERIEEEEKTEEKTKIVLKKCNAGGRLYVTVHLLNIQGTISNICSIFSKALLDFYADKNNLSQNKRFELHRGLCFDFRIKEFDTINFADGSEDFLLHLRNKVLKLEKYVREVREELSDFDHTNTKTLCELILREDVQSTYFNGLLNALNQCQEILKTNVFVDKNSQSYLQYTDEALRKYFGQEFERIYSNKTLSENVERLNRQREKSAESANSDEINI